MTSQALSVYGEYFRGAEVIAAISEQYKPIYEEIFPNWTFCSFLSPELLNAGRQKQFDLLIDFRSDKQSARLRKNFKCKDTFFFDFKVERQIVHDRKDRGIKLYATTKIKDLAHEIGTEMAAWKMDAELISAAIIEDSESPASNNHLILEPNHKLYASQVATGISHIFIFPCGLTPVKRWPTSNWVALIGKLVQKTPISIHIFLGPKEEREISNFCDIGPTVCVYQSESWTSIIRKLGPRILVLANDCGPMHACAVLGIPVAAIFGPTNPNVWFTYSRPSRFFKTADNSWPDVDSVVEKLFTVSCGGLQLQDEKETSS